jgi:hypothetical protein
MIAKEISVKREFFITSLFIEDMISKHISEFYAEVLSKEQIARENLFATFHDKIDYLLESGCFSIIDASKISVFREIRKEFLMSDDSETLEESLRSEDNNADFLLIMYPQGDYLPRNEKLTVACYNLINDVSELVAKFTNKNEVQFTKVNAVKRKVAHNMNVFSRVGMFLTLFLFK